MSHVSRIPAPSGVAHGPLVRVGPVIPVIIAAAMLLVALLAAEILIGLHAAPAIDLLAPAYVT